MIEKKEILKMLKEMGLDTIKKVDNLFYEMEDLRHNFYLFQTYVSRCKEIILDNKLEESKTKQNEINELVELYTNIKTVKDRINSNISKIQILIEEKTQITKTFVDTTNQSFKDMYTNYEITIARYSDFLFEYNIDTPAKSLTDSMKDLTKAVNNLENIIVDFNKKSTYKLLPPFEESKIAETIHIYGFSIISEKDWKDLVVYRG